MSTTVSQQARREAPAVAEADASSKPRALVGIAMAVWTALLGLAGLVCLTLTAWVTGNHHDDAIRPALSTAVQIWLLAQHATLTLVSAVKPGSAPGATATFSVLPLGVTFLLGLALVRGGRRAARLSRAHDLFDCAATAFSVAIPYAVVAALLTSAARTDGVRVSPLAALVGAFVLALCCVAAGALRETGYVGPVLARLPADARLALSAGFAASAVLVAGGAVLVAGSLVVHAGRATSSVDALHGGVTAAGLVSVISMAYAPNAALWATSYATGPGFAVGAGSSVSVAGAHLAAVPSFPMLAAVPVGPHSASFGWFVVVVFPAAGGIVAARLVCKWRDSGAKLQRSWWLSRLDDATRVAAAAAVAGVTLGSLAWLSGGSLGPGRMAVIGPSPWWVALATTLEIAVVGSAAVCVERYLDRRRAVVLPA